MGKKSKKKNKSSKSEVTEGDINNSGNVDSAIDSGFHESESSILDVPATVDTPSSLKIECTPDTDQSTENSQIAVDGSPCTSKKMPTDTHVSEQTTKMDSEKQTKPDGDTPICLSSDVLVDGHVMCEDNLAQPSKQNKKNENEVRPDDESNVPNEDNKISESRDAQTSKRKKKRKRAKENQQRLNENNVADGDKEIIDTKSKDSSSKSRERSPRTCDKFEHKTESSDGHNDWWSDSYKTGNESKNKTKPNDKHNDPSQSHERTRNESEHRNKPNYKRNESSPLDKGPQKNYNKSESKTSLVDDHTSYKTSKQGSEWTDRRKDKFYWDKNASKTYSESNGRHNDSNKLYRPPAKRYEKEYGNKSESEGKPFKSVVQEIHGDLFSASEEYSLAHCVAEDFRMGAGIAVEFKKKFRGVGELLDQRKMSGDVAFLKRGNRYIYYLVTKKLSYSKPTMLTMEKSLRTLRNLCEKHHVKKLAMPLIGCGLDKLIWENVRRLLDSIFQNAEIDVVVYHYEEPDESAEVRSPLRPKSLRVKEVLYPLVDIAAETALVVYGSLDGFADKTCNRLETKYPFIKKYENECRGHQSELKLGDFFPIMVKGEYVCVFIIRNKSSDIFQFSCLEKCIKNFNKFLRKENYYYVGIETFEGEIDPIINEKIVTVFQHHLNTNIELYVCSPSAN